MRYLITIALTVVVLLTPVAVLNWSVDPAALFRSSSFGHQFARALINSNHGLFMPGALDEREFKSALTAVASSYDCAVIGSSHVMQIGSDRKNRSFPRCQKILNLGVSGAGIEDHVVLSWLAATKGKPRALILGIDPWSLAFNTDPRWKARYPEQYSLALGIIDLKSSTLNTISSRWQNLINVQYSARSLHHLLIGEQYSEGALLALLTTPRKWGGALSNARRGAPLRQIMEAQSVDEDLGGSSPITLPDGSHIYSSDYIAKQKVAKIPMGGDAYKTEGETSEVRAIELYQRLIMWIKMRGIEPVLLLTPYHQNVWALETSANVKAMVKTEKIVRELGDKLNVPVVGSFRPDIVGCAPDEFYDFMHPMASCVARFTARESF